jgi:hypothetical protein
VVLDRFEGAAELRRAPKGWASQIVLKPFGIFFLATRGVCFHAEICFLSKSVMMEMGIADYNMMATFFCLSICLTVNQSKKGKWIN